MTSHVLVSLRVAASPERAFEVFTREVGLWWRPNRLFAFDASEPSGVPAFDAALGGRFFEMRSDGSTFEIGRITIWEPAKRLGFTWRQATFTADQSTEVEVRFDAVGMETRVTVEHRGWDTIPQAHVARHTMENSIFLRRHGERWQALLNGFRARLS